MILKRPLPLLFAVSFIHRLSSDFILVVRKHPDKGDLRKGACLCTVTRYSSSCWNDEARNSQQPATSPARVEQGQMDACFHSTSSLLLSVPGPKPWEQGHPQWADLPTSINVVRMILHRYARRPTSLFYTVPL